MNYALLSSSTVRLVGFAARGAAVVVFALVAGAGCGAKKAPTPPATPQQRVRISSTAPLVIYATEGNENGEVLVTVLNQTKKELRVLPAYFALILGNDRRALRPFDVNRDRAMMAANVLPGESQMPVTLLFDVKADLGGKRVVFNPEPEGWRPVFCEIERRSAPQDRAIVELPR